MLAYRALTASLFSLALVALAAGCSAPVEEDQTDSALGAASTEEACSGNDDTCGPGKTCRPQAHDSREGICSNERAPIDRACFSHATCAEGLSCIDGWCAQKCTQYNSGICGAWHCIPFRAWSSEGMCKRNAANLGEPCMNNYSCYGNLVCENGLCDTPSSGW